MENNEELEIVNEEETTDIVPDYDDCGTDTVSKTVAIIGGGLMFAAGWLTGKAVPKIRNWMAKKKAKKAVKSEENEPEIVDSEVVDEK